MNSHKLGFYTAIAIVIANMIGTGVFTTLGFQVAGIHDGFTLIALWVVGGVLALCGALSYGEIGAAFPENGGEYHYLSKLYHPALGFLSGWVSVTVGFAAPIAAASMALSTYIHSVFPNTNVLAMSLLTIIAITLVHSFNLKSGGAFQRVFTFIKIGFIIAFIAFGISYSPEFEFQFAPSGTTISSLFSSNFATALIYVTYAYSGWNAASYIAGELSNVNKTLPKALFLGTFIVLIIYTLLNYIFLKSTPINELTNQVEVGYLSANHIFGTQIGGYMGLAIALLLISTISAMIIAGPRVMEKMGNQNTSLKFLAITNKNKVPYVAIGIQSFIAILLVYFSSFDALLTYVGFTLNLFTFLTVFGIFILRYKMPHINLPFKSPLFPIPSILFLLIIGWILINALIQKPYESLLGLLTVFFGLSFYFITVYFERKKNETI